MSTGQAITIGMSIGSAITLLAVALIALSNRDRNPAPRPPVPIWQGLPVARNEIEEFSVCLRFLYHGDPITRRIALDPDGWRPFHSGFLYHRKLHFQASFPIPDPGEIEAVLDWFDLDAFATIRPFTNAGPLSPGDTCIITNLDFTSSDLTRRRQ